MQLFMRIFLQLITNALCEFQDKEFFDEMATFLGTDKRVGVSLPIQE